MNLMVIAMAVRFCLFLLSMTGYVLFCTQKRHIRIEFAPALFCACASNLMFAGGILNFMPETVCIIFLGGFFLLALSLKRGVRVEKWDAVLYAGFCLALVYFAILLRGGHYLHYDNFSHWATVVRDMLLMERMPNFADSMIRFESYPLGSGLFIYFACRIIGTTDACLLWAQLLMLLSFLFCMMAFVRKKNWHGIFFIALFSIWVLTLDSRVNIYELLVDILLPLAGVAAFAVIYYYKDSPQKAVYCSASLFVLLVNIKNSGVFFYAVCVLFLIAYTWDYIRRHKACFITASLFFPLATIFIWKRHVALVFPDGMNTVHAMSIVHYKNMLMGKTKGDIAQIGRMIAERLLSFESIEVKMLLFFMLLGIMLLLSGQPVKKTARIMAADLGCMGIYIFFTYAMYIFSMPLGEALVLSCYDRYILSVLVFVYGTTMIFLIEPAGNPQKGVLAAALLLVMCPVWQNRARLPLLYQKQDYAVTERCLLQELIKRDGLEKEKSCFLYRKAGHQDGFWANMTRHELWTPDVAVAGEEDFADKKQMIENYDYFIIWDSDDNTDQWLAEHHMPQYQGVERLGIRVKE